MIITTYFHFTLRRFAKKQYDAKKKDSFLADNGFFSFFSRSERNHLQNSASKQWLSMCNLDKIVDRCKKGDRKAGEQLYHMFSAKMFAVCIQYSKSREEAEDNLQDGFIKVLESIGQYKGKGSFEGWMKRIFINTALEKFRKNRSVQVVEEVPEVVDEDDVDDDVSIPPEVLFEFVNQLPEKYRLVFNLYVMEDMQHKEIAALLGISDGTSKSNLARAKEILKRKINAYLRDE